MTRVFIVAASLRGRRELAFLLARAPDVEVVGTSSSLDDVTEDWEDLDVLLVRDANDSTEELFELLEEKGLTRQTPVLLILEQAAQSQVNRAIQLGVRGILPADLAPEQLIRAAEAVAKGLMVLQPGELARAPTFNSNREC